MGHLSLILPFTFGILFKQVLKGNHLFVGKIFFKNLYRVIKMWIGGFVHSHRQLTYILRLFPKDVILTVSFCVF